MMYQRLILHSKANILMIISFSIQYIFAGAILKYAILGFSIFYFVAMFLSN